MEIHSLKRQEKVPRMEDQQAQRPWGQEELGVDPGPQRPVWLGRVAEGEGAEQ